MSLPFLKDDERKAGGVGKEYRSADGTKNKREDIPGLRECAQDFIDGVKASDVRKVEQAFQDAFDILEARPHDEFDHDQDDSYVDEE